jgi:hypothetical protein
MRQPNEVTMRRPILSVAVAVAASVALAGAERPWQRGTLRDLKLTADQQAISVPLSAGAAVPPLYVSVAGEWEYVTIDGTDGLRYLARWHQRLTPTVINDPVMFIVADGFVYVKGDKNAESKKRLRLVSTTRLAPK